MRSALAKGLSLLGATLMLSALAPACAHNDTSLFINGVLDPPTTTAGSACVYQPGGALQLVPKFDVSAADSYITVLDVRSQLLARISRDQVRTETNVAVLKGAVVRVTDPAGLEIAPAFTYLTQGTLRATTADAASGFVAVALLNQAAVVALRNRLPTQKDRVLAVANVKVFGDTLGGQSLESNEYAIPITVCRGCSMDFTCAPIDPATLVPDCTQVTATVAACIVPCNAGERPTACQLCTETGIDPVTKIDNRSFCNGTHDSLLPGAP